MGASCCACMHCRVHSLRPWSSQLLIISTLSRSIAMGSMSPPPAVNNYYRADGVRITHDPHAPGMAEKYGRPGETDNEGFDPYADTVGPGIYGGIVKRDAHGTVVIGRQYQNHNPRPGPVYAGGGYTPTCRALGDNERLAALLDKFPDLVNDISTGGAQPLHNCGMSQANQHSTSLLISRGADIEAIDSYGYTPLHRMASNNLPIGAQALLDAGADPQFRGGSGQTPMQVAQSSHATDVIKVLQKHGSKRKPVPITEVVVSGSGVESVNQRYQVADPSEMPVGFAQVCTSQGWPEQRTWQQLGGSRPWYSADNGAYIYWNTADKSWWIDMPNGNGVYKAAAPEHAPPQTGWQLLGDVAPAPALVASFRTI